MSTGTVALVTGANRGIGLEVARQLGRRGTTVVLGARDAGRGAAAEALLRAEGIDARAVPLDVTDAATVAAALARVRAEVGRLDVLVNNAGVAPERAGPSAVALDVVRAVFEVNVLGAVAVIQAALPLLRAAPAGRIVNTSSSVGSLTLGADPTTPVSRVLMLGYATSKAALNAVTVQFANELRGTAVKVNSADPGFVATDLNGGTGTDTVQDGARAVLRLATLPADGPTGGFFDAAGRVPF